MSLHGNLNRFIFHISYFIFHISYFIFHISYFIFHISYFIFQFHHHSSSFPSSTSPSFLTMMEVDPSDPALTHQLQHFSRPPPAGCLASSSYLVAIESADRINENDRINQTQLSCSDSGRDEGCNSVSSSSSDDDDEDGAHGDKIDTTSHRSDESSPSRRLKTAPATKKKAPPAPPPSDTKRKLQDIRSPSNSGNKKEKKLQRFDKRHDDEHSLRSEQALAILRSMGLKQYSHHATGKEHKPGFLDLAQFKPRPCSSLSELIHVSGCSSGHDLTNDQCGCQSNVLMPVGVLGHAGSEDFVDDAFLRNTPSYVMVSFPQLGTLLERLDPIHHCFATVVLPGFPVHFYFDLDRSGVHALDPEVCGEFEALFAEFFQSTFQRAPDMSGWHWESACTDSKFSTHAHLVTEGMVDVAHLGRWCKAFEQFICEKNKTSPCKSSLCVHHRWPSVMDTCIYSANRLFRLALNSKPGKQRLNPTDGTASRESNLFRGLINYAVPDKSRCMTYGEDKYVSRATHVRTVALPACNVSSRRLIDVTAALLEVVREYVGAKASCDHIKLLDSNNLVGTFAKHSSFCPASSVRSHFTSPTTHSSSQTRFSVNRSSNVLVLSCFGCADFKKSFGLTAQQTRVLFDSCESPAAAPAAPATVGKCDSESDFEEAIRAFDCNSIFNGSSDKEASNGDFEEDGGTLDNNAHDDAYVQDNDLDLGPDSDSAFESHVNDSSIHQLSAGRERTNAFNDSQSVDSCSSDFEAAAAAAHTTKPLASQYYWGDFLREFQHSPYATPPNVFANIAELVQTMVSRMKATGVFCQILKDGLWCRKLSESDKFDLIPMSKRRSCELLMAYRVEGDDKCAVRTIGFTKFVLKYASQIPSYTFIVFRPPTGDERDLYAPTDVLNVYPGFKAQLVERVDERIIQPVLDHIRLCWADNDPGQYKYLISLLADRVRHPGVRTGIALFLYGNKGVGKNIILDWIIEFIYGDSTAVSVPGLDRLVAKFNSLLGGKLFINPNETSKLDANSATSHHAVFDMIKAFITDPKIPLERKGIDTIMVQFFGFFVFTSNHDWCLKVEESDRRYACFKCSEVFKGNHRYFKDLSAKLTQNTANHFLTYLMNYKIDIDLRDIPETELRRQMMEHSQSTVVSFLKKLQHMGVKGVWHEENRSRELRKESPLPYTALLLVDPAGGEAREWMPARALFELFLSWIHSSKEKGILPESKFGAVVKEYVPHRRVSEGVQYDMNNINV
jgi:hypothetical protein